MDTDIKDKDRVNDTVEKLLQETASRIYSAPSLPLECNSIQNSIIRAGMYNGCISDRFDYKLQ